MESVDRPGRTVFIDPGHRNNEHDFGAVGPTGLRESEVALFVSHCLRTSLEPDYRVVMSRYGEDAKVSLSARTKAANEEPADIFVSIHTNAHSDPSAHGVEILHWPTSAQGVDLASAILPPLVKATGDRNRGLKPRTDLAVLRQTRMPAVLVELPFISHPTWEETMRDCQFQLDCARAIADGIRAYFKEMRT